MESKAFSASSTSSRADWDRAIVCSPSKVPWRVLTKATRWLLNVQEPGRELHHDGGRHRRGGSVTEPYLLGDRGAEQRHGWGMQSVYEAVGGWDALVSLARAWHARVMADDVVSHAFSHGFHPQHSERLAAYWAEALGGPSAYSATYGDETFVVRMHSGNGEHEEMDRRAIACFDQALTDVGLTTGNPVGKCCTTTSPGRPPQPCPSTRSPREMCPRACPCRTGPGTDRSLTPSRRAVCILQSHIG